MKNFVFVKNPCDAAALLKEANGMHDGYLTKVEFQNNGIKPDEDGFHFTWKNRRLKLNILITSMPDALLEMVFEDVLKWKITEGENDILKADIRFDKNGSIVWSDDTIDFDKFEQNCSYIVARKLKWRFL